MKAMAENKWTAEQLQAITEKDCNLLVAAAAGSGKTAVLVERIIRKITGDENPVDIDRLLIVTFTNAAATEMRERIAEAISKALESNPGSNILQRQLTLLNKASITTMHSFCLNVIKNNFQYIDLDPNFRIANETETLLMKIEVLDEIFEEFYEDEAGKEEFLELLECYGGNRDDQSIQEMVLTLYEFVQSHPWPSEWLKEKSEMFNLQEGSDFAGTAWGRILVKNVSLELRELKERLQRAMDTAGASEGLEAYLPVYREEVSRLEEALKFCSTPEEIRWDDLFSTFSALHFDRLPRCGKDADKEKQEYVKSIRDDVKSGIKKLKEDLFQSGSEEICGDLKSLYPIIKCLSGMVDRFSERYAMKKRQKFLVDFNDLEHFCLNILTRKNEKGEVGPSEVALSYRERFCEILVDEYQDSNLVQEIIVNIISRADDETPNIFMVGDVKQSIYRFRQAKPELFLEKYSTYSSKAGEKSRKIQLFKNFRSRGEVVDSVNFVFKQIMSGDVGEIEYNDAEALNLGASFPEAGDASVLTGGATELHIIDVSGTDAGSSDEEEEADESEEAREENDEEPRDAIQREAGIVASRIRELTAGVPIGKEFRVFDKNSREYRRVDYKDIVILLRTTRNWMDVFVEELNAQGIPAFADTGTGFFRTVEVQIVLSLLQIIDNPLQDIPLLSVLRSPIAAFTSDELVDIRMADRDASIYDALRKIAGEEAGEVSKKAAGFLSCLGRWRDRAAYMSTDELIWYLYSDTGFYGYAGAMPGGQQRQANLRILFERARQYEETSYKGLFNFINFINKLKSSKGDMGSAKILGENENVVRIMSIHKSKGLEFPVVILSGCGKQFNLQDMNKKMLLHQDLGFGPDFVDYKRRITYPSVPKQAIRYKIKTESLSEEMRVLYVAFTRAKEKLIITGTVKNFEKAAARWGGCTRIKKEKLPGYEMLRGRNYMDWICSSVMRHKSCGALREAAGIKDYDIIDDPSLWEIRVWNGRDELSGRTEPQEDEKEPLDCPEQACEAEIAGEYYEEIERRLNWQYEYGQSSDIPTKLSVTELKRRFAAEFSEEFAANAYSMPSIIRKPAFMEKTRGLSAAEEGSVLHFVLQHLDFRNASQEESIRFQVGEMIMLELLTEEQAKTVDIGKIHKFLLSPLGIRISNAGHVRREVPFNLEICCSEFYRDMAGINEEETILLQGVIDCYFEEPGGIVLLDYKTDYVPEGRSDTIKEKYRTQIEYYARALEKLTGNKVKEKYIYLFYNGEILEY